MPVGVDSISARKKEDVDMKKKLFALLALSALLCVPLSGCRSNYAAKPAIYLYPDEETCDAKPVDYLYPTTELEVTVTLDYDGDLTCVYPAFDRGTTWTVAAQPDGTLTDASGQTYNYLYWEGVTDIQYDFSQGFCVAGPDTAAFLEDALAQLGLNRREANEFIVYWLPKMQDNPYNLIAFQTSAYTDHARLTISPEPDSLLRVFMAWKPLNTPVDIPAQSLPTFTRTGFTVVEWGGTEIS
jgi:hypothetical protein